MAGIFGNRIVERLWVGVTRRPVAFLTSSIILLTSSLLASCGPDGNQFEMSGKFKGFSQGELYLYATDGPSQKLDTIAVVNGTFEFTTTLDNPRTYIIVFPNFSELPVIGEPGEEVTIEGDVSHLKEVEVEGTEANEALTAAHCGMPCLAFSVITNMAAGILDQPLSDEEVNQVGHKIAGAFSAYLGKVVERL